MLTNKHGREKRISSATPGRVWTRYELCICYLGVLNLQEGRSTLIQNKICGPTMSSLSDSNTSDVNSLGVCVLVKKNVCSFVAFLPNFLCETEKWVTWLICHQRCLYWDVLEGPGSEHGWVHSCQPRTCPGVRGYLPALAPAQPWHHVLTPVLPNGNCRKQRLALPNSALCLLL